MRSDTRTATITAAPKDVLAFVGNPANLPRWAIGFARDIRRDDGRWIVSTGQGEIPVSIDVNEDAGTVDFRMEVAPNREVVAYSRVVERRRFRVHLHPVPAAGRPGRAVRATRRGRRP